MLFIPEIELLTIIDDLLNSLRSDFERNKSNKDKSYLYKFFGESKMHDFKFFDQAVNIICSKAGTKRHLKTNIGFNLQRASMPCIHIITSDESPEGDGIGQDEGYNENEYDDKTFNISYTRTYSCDYSLFITSENMGEVVLLYHLIRALLISQFLRLEDAGFRNVRLSGKDTVFQQDLMPNNIYHKIVSISFFYEVAVLNMNNDIYINDHNFNGQVIK